MMYQWYVNDIPDPEISGARVRITQRGKYQVIGQMDGCIYTSDTINFIRRASLPVITATINMTVSFTGNSLCGKRQLWEFGDGHSDTAKNLVHVYPRHGSYKVVLKTWDAENVIDSNVKTLILFESITDEFDGYSYFGEGFYLNYDKNFHCQQAAVLHDDSIFAKGPPAVFYYGRDGSPPAFANIISYPKTGTFEIKVFPQRATQKNGFGPLLDADTGLIMVVQNTARLFMLEFSRWGGVRVRIDSLLVGSLQPGVPGPLQSNLTMLRFLSGKFKYFRAMNILTWVHC